MTSIAKGAGIFLLGAIAGTGLKYLFELFLARKLGPALFGIFFLGITVFKLLEKIAALELNSGMLRFVPIFRGEGNTERVKGTVIAGLRIASLMAAGATILLIIFSQVLAKNVFHAQQLSAVLRFLALGLILTAATEIIVFSLQAFGAVQYRVLVRQIIEPALSLLLAVPLLILGWGLNGAIMAFLLPLPIGFLLACSFLKKVFPAIAKRDTAAVSDTKSLLRFSLPLFLAGLLSLFLQQINPLMLGYFRPSGEVGVFAAALRTALLLLLILDSFNAIFSPMISDLLNKGAGEKLEELFKIVTKWVLTLSFPALLVLISFGGEILALWGKGYREGLTCLVILCLGQFINCATGPVGYMISMSGRTKISLANAAGALLINIILNILLIPRYGILGCAVAVAAAVSLINLIRLVEVWLILKVHPYRLDTFKPLAAGAAAFFILFIVKTKLLHFDGTLLRIALGTLIFAACYAALLALLGIAEEEKLVFNRIKHKIFS